MSGQNERGRGEPSGLDGFAADVLDWPAVRELFSAHVFTSLGRRALEELQPRRSDAARAALARVGELLGAGGKPPSLPPLAGISDPMPGLQEARRHKRPLSEESFHDLTRFLTACEVLGKWLESRAEVLEHNAAVFEGRPPLEKLREELERCIDTRGALRDEASPLLARLRPEIAKLVREIEEGVVKLSRRADLKGAMAEGHAGQVHRRGDRLVLAVRIRHRGQVPGIVHDRSQSGETVYVEPRDFVESGNRLAILRSDERREVTRVLIELTRTVLERQEDIEENARRVAEIELACVGAVYARETDARPAREPESGQGRGAGELVLRSMRHPLLLDQELRGQIDHTVPLDLRIGGDFDLLVITGPNTGGKTLALKSAGLAVLLTRLGLPLPCAEGTCVPLYDGVFADIGDEQEIRQNLSTFSSHLVRIREGLERAGPATLVLLDELGGGTDPEEGAALGDAVMQVLLERGAPTLASTHLGRLKEFAFRHSRAENACVEFDIETLAPCYRLLVGTPGESRALAIARRMGLPAEVLDRAAARLDRAPGEADRLMSDLRDARQEAERVRGRADERLEQVEGRIAHHEQEREELERNRELLSAEAQRGLEDLVREVGPDLERARALLPQMPRQQRQVLEGVLAGFERALARAGTTERREAFLEGLSKGDLVYLPRYRKRCPVVRVERGQQRVTVRMGRQDFTVPFEDVTFLDRL